MSEQTNERLAFSFSAPSSADNIEVSIKKGRASMDLTRSDLELIVDVYGILASSADQTVVEPQTTTAAQ